DFRLPLPIDRYRTPERLDCRAGHLRLPLLRLFVFFAHDRSLQGGQSNDHLRLPRMKPFTGHLTPRGQIAPPDHERRHPVCDTTVTNFPEPTPEIFERVREVWLSV